MKWRALACGAALGAAGAFAPSSAGAKGHGAIDFVGFQGLSLSVDDDIAPGRPPSFLHPGGTVFFATTDAGGGPGVLGEYDLATGRQLRRVALGAAAVKTPRLSRAGQRLHAAALFVDPAHGEPSLQYLAIDVETLHVERATVFGHRGVVADIAHGDGLVAVEWTDDRSKLHVSVFDDQGGLTGVFDLGPVAQPPTVRQQIAAYQGRVYFTVATPSDQLFAAIRRDGTLEKSVVFHEASATAPTLAVLGDALLEFSGAEMKAFSTQLEVVDHRCSDANDWWGPAAVHEDGRIVTSRGVLVISPFQRVSVPQALPGDPVRTIWLGNRPAYLREDYAHIVRGLSIEDLSRVASAPPPPDGVCAWPVPSQS